jgi:histidinol dehydrogenase
MTAIPAAVAGVEEIVLCTPPDPATAAPADAIMAAAQVAGVTEVYRVGGAQAIAAMAFGTATIPACEKVVGPGNVYVTLAKREVYGIVGIDGLFGPSESLVVADERADASFVAAELLTQAEHDPEAAAVLVTTSEDMLSASMRELSDRMAGLPRADAIRDAIASHGLAVLVRNLEQAADVSNAIAPEHLCVHVGDPGAFLPLVRAAGTVLLGDMTAATLSDYCAGPSHVLPTARTARFSSGLGVRDFMVSINTVAYTRDGVAGDAPVARELAAAEDLQAHWEAVRVRLES